MTVNVQPEQAKWLLDTISGDSNSIHTFASLPVQGGVPQEFQATFEQAQPRLLNSNDTSGVYFTLNTINGKRRSENVVAVNTLFLDLDGAPLDPVYEAARAGAPPPHAIIESSPDRFHCYWLVEDCSLEQFTPLQKALAQRFDGDPSVCDLPRLSRLPGFKHVKKQKGGALSEPFMSRVIHAQQDTPAYKVDHLIQGLQLQLVAPQESNSKSHAPFNIASTLVDGERTHALTQYCGKLIQQKVDDALALEMITGWNQARCNPPLPHEKLISTYISIKKTDSRNKDNAPSPITELNINHALTTIGGKAVVLREHKDRIEYMSAADFKLLYCDKQLEGKPLGTAWLQHPHRRKYFGGVTFNPRFHGHKDDEYNLFRGFGCEPKAGNCELFLNHLKENICAGNAEHYEYLLDWLADMFQHPATLPGVAIVMKGARGAGKSIVATTIGSLWHKTHFKHITSPDLLVGRFNSHLQDCLLCFADEALFAGDKKAEQQLKTIISESQRMIEAKGKDAVMLPNFSRVIMATNSEWSIPAGPDERRYCVFEVAKTKAQNHAYFNALIQELEAGGREELLHLLLNRKIKSNVRKAPATQALLDQKLHSLDCVESWWWEALDRGAVGPCNQEGILSAHVTIGQEAWPKLACKDALYNHYLSYAHQHNINYPHKKTMFCKKLKQLAKVSDHRVVVEGKRTRYYAIESLEDSRSTFADFLQQPIQWDY